MKTNRKKTDDEIPNQGRHVNICVILIREVARYVMTDRRTPIQVIEDIYWITLISLTLPLS